MAVAKSQLMFLWLKKQFQDRKVEKNTLLWHTGISVKMKAR